ncbi:MAG: hypothetical protein GPI90_12085 [Microcystis aeruginosa K13-05]|jgi:hypothetical protein|uniref:hypothetical protein n=1 Tax=Microcystis sp. LE19-41.2A TaxID=3016427 RepID=UPI0022C80E85|nr:hypothetical protein [Microcystis sp. LE19-41.2A]MCZ8048829.1 hypothetical protein [Microcystis sp. LE19-41.2A]MDJ0528565.1 hypothetical protein [Microcystis sp. M53600_WE12]NCR80752.1 hypothetical protein [Microcystis aeruginosa K13-10]NCR85346.1 hypothetical protein [Microcystis aeruginosa K13-05]
MKVKLLIFLSLCTALSIVGSTIFAFSGKMSTAQTTVSKAYEDALIDAADSLPDEVLDNLTAIVESNPKLIWEGQPGNSRVLVATFTGAIGYKSGQKIFPPSEIWVTVVPELKDFCTNYKNTGVDKNQLNLRLKQLLGLPPNREYVKVAEIWVHPQYLKRPTLDTEINDRTIQPITNSIHTLLFPQGVDSAYQAWFINQIKNRELNRNPSKNLERLTNNNSQDDPYPFTGLGYTYDWGIYPKTNLQTNAGLSEFVIFLGTQTQVSIPIEVKQVLSTEEYCKVGE